jgi:succinate-acetate transporter protein
MGFDIVAAAQQDAKKAESIRNARTLDEVSSDLKDDIQSSKDYTLATLKQELSVEKQKLEELKSKQQMAYVSSTFLIAFDLFLLLILLGKVKVKVLNFSQKNIDRKRINLLLLVWTLFHLFLLITTNKIFVTRNSFAWENFWVLADWEEHPFYYDVTEFFVYALIPLLIVLGRRYLKGDKVF